MVPPAPSLFSITTVWPSVFIIAAPSVRATTSVGPPAANGTTSVTVRDGYASPHAVATAAADRASAQSAFIASLMGPPPWAMRRCYPTASHAGTALQPQSDRDGHAHRGSLLRAAARRIRRRCREGGDARRGRSAAEVAPVARGHVALVVRAGAQQEIDCGEPARARRPGDRA